jgi:hypothetical protein
MSPQFRRRVLGLAAATVIGLVAVPIGAQSAAPAAVGGTVSAAPAPAKLAVSPDVGGLYAFNSGGYTGWLFLHTKANGSITAVMHLDGQSGREQLRASYDRDMRLLKLTRMSGGYRHEYNLWLAHQPGGVPSFGGYADRRPVHKTAGAGAVAAYRYGVHGVYISDDAV